MGRPTPGDNRISQYNNIIATMKVEFTEKKVLYFEESIIFESIILKIMFKYYIKERVSFM